VTLYAFDDDRFDQTLSIRSSRLDFPDHFHTANHFTKGAKSLAVEVAHAAKIQ